MALATVVVAADHLVRGLFWPLPADCGPTLAEVLSKVLTHNPEIAAATQQRAVAVLPVEIKRDHLAGGMHPGVGASGAQD